jgi:hypothetical protein
MGLILSTWLLQNGTGSLKNGHCPFAALYFYRFETFYGHVNLES